MTTNNRRILLIFDWVTASIRSLFVALLFAMPDAALYLARYWFPGPMDRLFKESLDSFMSQIENQQFRLAATKATQSLDAALSDADTPETRARTSKNFNDFLKRYWARFRILLGVWLLSFVPIFGILAWPAATFVYMSEKVNWPFALFLLVLSFLSRRMHNYIRGPLLRTVFQIRALSRELVDPYLSRSQMNPDKKHEWLQRNDAVILGFTLPLFALLYIPLLGPALYFALANSAAARLILEIIDPVDFQEEGAIPGVPTRGLCESRLGYSYGAPVIQFLLVVATQADTLFDKALLHLSLQTEAVISKIEAVKTFDHIMQDVGAFLRNLEGEKIKRE
ncbi:hypothetical protein BC830DRAFT_1092169 [Chytriomyces sp. MP71]|nr:hypothetical protein BC830DRAFT_1092169 [Chytriomyces sp. MP71]